jgi:hypothetical protein
MKPPRSAGSHKRKATIFGPTAFDLTFYTFGSNNFWVEQLLGRTSFGSNKFWVEQLLGRTTFGLNNFWVEQVLGQQVLGQTTLNLLFFGSNNFWVKHFLGQTTFVSQHL